MDFFCFSTWGFFSHFIAFGLRLSASGFNGFFFCFSTCSFFSYFSAFRLRLSGSGFDWFSLFFDLQLLLPFYWLWLKPSGSGFDGFYLFFNLLLLFPFYWLWFKAVWFFPWWIFFVFPLAASFPILVRFVWGRRVQALMDFLCFSTCSFFSHFIAFGLNPSGLGFDGFFFFRLPVFFPILLPLV